MSKKTSFSPVPHKREQKEKKQYKFKDVIEQLLVGRKVHKLEWENKDNYFYLAKDGVLLLHKEDGKDYQFVLQKADLEGEDFILL